jgi:hypothetical protein
MNYKGDLIVSRYKEDVSWLKQVPYYRTFLYNKGNQLDDSIVLPNIGRETHTYFHHIIQNYDNLAEWLFFTQGHPFDHVRNYVEFLNNFPSVTIPSPLRINKLIYFLSNAVFSKTLHSKSDGSPHHFNVIDIDGLWYELFEDAPPNDYQFTAGAIFMASKEIILSRSKSFYEKCLDLSVNREHGPWEFERIFPSLFDPKKQSKK